MSNKVTIFSVLFTIAQAVCAVFNFLSMKHKTKNDKKAIQEKELKKSKDKMCDVCDNGSMSDLIDATLDVKRIKNK